MKKRLKIVLPVVTGIIIILVSLYAAFLVKQKDASFVVELGGEISRDLSDYVEGFQWSVNLSKLDLSDVEAGKAGRYKAYIKHGWQKFEYKIKIVDTTAPELTLRQEEFYIERDKEYLPEDFVNAFDVSGQVKLTSQHEKILFDDCGKYQFTITAEDINGNVSEKNVEVCVDDAPEIYNVTNYYVVPGSQIDFLDGISAFDRIDGNLSDKVMVDTDEIKLDEEGEYEAVYYVYDRYGLRTEKTAVVKVCDAMELQELINTHKLNINEDCVMGAYNLYDAGYEKQEDVKKVREMVEPSLVRIDVDTDEMQGWGSGFIIEITDEAVYIFSNQHVLKYNNGDGFKVYFHDGSSAVGTNVAITEKPDMGIMRVPLENIDEDVLKTLKTVHINEGYWDELEKNEDIILCVRAINYDGSVWQDMSGKLVDKFTISDRVDMDYYMVQYTINAINGMSGSPVFDAHGNMVAMVTLFVYGGGKRENYGVSLDDILEFYEESVGHKPNYY